MKNGDEIVIQLIDREDSIFRLIHENKFIVRTQQIRSKFDSAHDDREASDSLSEISEWISIDKETATLSEFQRLVQRIEVEKRKRVMRKESRVKESVPPNLKVILGESYKGYCQVCDFWFLKKDRTPYYEIHHINDQLGNRLQNLLLVCGSCHNQFTYSNVTQ